MPKFQIGKRWVGDSYPTYFIADVAANHDGDLSRAKLLIRLAKEAGADAAKFQHFLAPKIVSDYGFKALGKQLSHQSTWSKSVFEVYQEASLPRQWTAELKECADKVGIDFFSSPYDFEAVDLLEPLVPAYKIGSGDITWTEILQKIAKKGKPVLLAIGASDMDDVRRAVDALLPLNRQLALMQCNTNYTGSTDNFDHIHLRVLETLRKLYPDVVLGLSDHTPGDVTVLGAIALGARVIEKHFTDDQKRTGPDHGFSMNPKSWNEMVERSRLLERSLGIEKKVVADNEKETVVLQRRCLRAARALPVGVRLALSDIEALRPAPQDGIFPYDIDKLVGCRTRKAFAFGEHFVWKELEK